jgi:hypothetical protein
MWYGLNTDVVPRLAEAPHMMSVRDMFVEALSMKANGFRPRQIREKLLDLGHANGFPVINENGGDIGGGVSFELIFDNAGRIAFDGADWHYFNS